jgi:hypothetical protein
VAIGRRARDPCGADASSGAGYILNDDRLPERPAQMFGQNASD